MIRIGEVDLADKSMTSVSHRHTQWVAARLLTPRGKRRIHPPRCCFGHLTAGIGIDVGDQHHDDDIQIGLQNVDQHLQADIEGPTVTADD